MTHEADKLSVVAFATLAYVPEWFALQYELPPSPTVLQPVVVDLPSYTVVHGKTLVGAFA